jgi:hypothetical protein
MQQYIKKTFMVYKMMSYILNLVKGIRNKTENRVIILEYHGFCLTDAD